MPNRPVRSKIISRAILTGVFVALSSVAVRADAAEGPASAAESDKRRVESYEPPIRTRAERLATCMELWEPATHMTKSDWKRVCNRVEITP